MASITQAEAMVKAAISFNLDLIKTDSARDAQTIIPYLEGKPGIGKTAIINKVGKDLGMVVEVVRLSEYEPSEMAGWCLPEDDKSRMIRIAPDWIPDGSTPTIVFFDEMPQGNVMVQNVAAQAVNERRVGPHHLPDNAIIVCAGNPHTDRAGTNRMPTHLADRLTFIDVEANVEDTVAYFLDNDIDTRICGYLKFRPDMLSVFDRDAKACPSPRSWERVNSWMRTELPSALKQIAIKGQIGEAASVDFTAYLKLTAAVPDIDDLIANPTDESKAPTKFTGEQTGILYAIAAALIPRMNAKTAKNIVTYVRRLPRQEIAAFVMADSIRRDKTLTQVEAVRAWLLDEGREYLLKD